MTTIFNSVIDYNVRLIGKLINVRTDSTDWNAKEGFICKTLRGKSCKGLS